MNPKILIIILNFTIATATVVRRIIIEKRKYKLSYGKSPQEFEHLIRKLSNKQKTIIRETLLGIKSIPEKEYFLFEVARLFKENRK